MPAPKGNDEFLKKLTDAICGPGKAGGGQGDDWHDRIKPLYAGKKPPALNEDGSLTNPDAGPPKKAGAKKKAGASAPKAKGKPKKK